MASHGSDTPTSPRAILHHTDAILCTFLHTTVYQIKIQLQKSALYRCEHYYEEVHKKVVYLILVNVFKIKTVAK